MRKKTPWYIRKKIEGVSSERASEINRLINKIYNHEFKIPQPKLDEFTEQTAKLKLNPRNKYIENVYTEGLYFPTKIVLIKDITSKDVDDFIAMLTKQLIFIDLVRGRLDTKILDFLGDYKQKAKLDLLCWVNVKSIFTGYVNLSKIITDRGYGRRYRILDNQDNVVVLISYLYHQYVTKYTNLAVNVNLFTYKEEVYNASRFILNFFSKQNISSYNHCIKFPSYQTTDLRRKTSCLKFGSTTSLIDLDAHQYYSKIYHTVKKQKIEECLSYKYKNCDLIDLIHLTFYRVLQKKETGYGIYQREKDILFINEETVSKTIKASRGIIHYTEKKENEESD